MLAASEADGEIKAEEQRINSNGDEGEEQEEEEKEADEGGPMDENNITKQH